jgi:hypothetical protein
MKTCNCKPLQGGSRIPGFPKERMLFEAISSRNWALVEEILQAHTDIVNYPRKGDGFTPLHCAVYTKDEEMINLLLEFGADPNKSCKIKTLTPLALALKTADTEPLIIQNLIYYGRGFGFKDILKDILYYYEQRLKFYHDVKNIKDFIEETGVPYELTEETTSVKKQGTTTASAPTNWCDVPLQPLNLVEDPCDLKRSSSPIGKNLLLGQFSVGVKTGVRELLPPPNPARCLSDIESPELPIGPESSVSSNKDLLGEAVGLGSDGLDVTFRPELVELD